MIASSWAAKDAAAAAEWVASMSAGPERDRSAGSLVVAIAERFPSEAWNWALRIDDPGERIRAAGEAAKMMAARDPASAREWIETAPLSAETKAQLQSVLAETTSSTGGGSAASR
jgi:hypothetical protein